MNIKVLSLLLGLFGQGLIAGIFFWIIPDSLPGDVRWLDFIVISIVYWLWMWSFVTPPIDLNDRSQKQVGGLGQRWSAIGLYSFLAVLFVCYNLYAELSGDATALKFSLQLIIQAIFLFLLLGGLLISQGINQKTGSVYAYEQTLKAGKADLKASIQQLLYKSEDFNGVPAEVKERLKKIAAETRYITPSTSAACLALDSDIVRSCDMLRSYLADYEVNQKQISSLIDQLERDLNRRRKTI